MIFDAAAGNITRHNANREKGRNDNQTRDNQRD
jgi:hypothetical protein